MLFRSPRGTNLAGAYIDGQIRGPALGTNSVGLTQVPTVLERSISIASVGVTPATGHAPVVFRAPASGATVTAVYINPGSVQNHAANEADVWTFRVKNTTTGNNLNALGASLSNTTLAATAWKSIPVDNGNSTVLSGHTLSLSMGISGSPAALQNPVCLVEWVPYSNA